LEIGFTHHQGSFLTLTNEGEVKVQGQATEEAVRSGQRQLKTDKPVIGKDARPTLKWPKLRSVSRDVASKVEFMIECSSPLI